MVHFVSSDAHNIARRPLKLRFAFDDVAERFGQEKAQALLIDNPLAAFEGRPLPHLPEVAPAYVTPKRKRFFVFLGAIAKFELRGGLQRQTPSGVQQS